jgi:Holliday junction resolvasome RuvABC DNA-binding subunit
VSIDQLVQEAVERQVRPLRDELAVLRMEVETAKSGLKRPVYDYHALRELGYSEHESRRVLRAFGHKRNGRYRVTVERLLAYQRGEGET